MDVDVSPEAQRLAINLLKAALKESALKAGIGEGGLKGTSREADDFAVSPALEKHFTKITQSFASAVLSVPGGVGSPANPCANILLRLNQLLEAAGAVPVIEVAAWRAQLLSCKKEGRITEAEYNLALQEIDHPPGRGGPK